MQGFIKTTAGLRPVLLDGIEEVTYTTNAGGLNHTGSLGIKYIPNSGTGTGNIFINIPAYDNLQYPIEKFWEWVNSVSAGQNKTYNQFLGSGVVIGAVVGTITTSAGLTPTTGYVIQVADDLSMEDMCALVFNTNATAEGPNYTNVVTNGVPTPAVFDHIFISSQQGYSPFDMIDTFSTTPSPNNAALPNGTYAFLNGAPQVTEKGSTFPQSGDVYRIVVRSGIIEAMQVCPMVFQVSELKGWIRSIFDFEGAPPDCAATCAQVAICNGCDLSEAAWDLGNQVGSWYPVKYAFNNISPPMPDDCPGGYAPYYGGNFQAMQQWIPVGAIPYIKGFYDTDYVPLINGSVITVDMLGPEAITVSVAALMSNGLAMYTTNSPVNTYVFEIDWGAEGYNDCEGNPITQAYFRYDPLVPGCTTPPMGTFASFLNDNFAGTVSGYAEFPCITQAGGGGGEPS
tara:strand:+ start:318 stop:1682 length:1365 start_codon:yes stop_codon:yes gene_type:complete